jgi:hypothetical protein
MNHIDYQAIMPSINPPQLPPLNNTGYEVEGVSNLNNLVKPKSDTVSEASVAGSDLNRFMHILK